MVYNFPKTKLVDGPLQIEARIDQNAQLSGQLTLWNQQGSHVRRGTLLVIPCGRALLYAEPIYLQAERSPMPELRLVVLALQDRLAYGSTFESAMASLFGGGVSSLTAAPTSAGLGSSATLIMTLGDTSEVYVKGKVDESDIGRVYLGQPARIKVESFKDKIFTGKVTKISPMGAEKDNVTTFEVRVSINNPGGELKAAMTANAEIILEEHHNVLQVP